MQNVVRRDVLNVNFQKEVEQLFILTRNYTLINIVLSSFSSLRISLKRAISFVSSEMMKGLNFSFEFLCSCMMRSSIALINVAIVPISLLKSHLGVLSAIGKYKYCRSLELKLGLHIDLWHIDYDMTN